MTPEQRAAIRDARQAENYYRAAGRELARAGELRREAMIACVSVGISKTATAELFGVGRSAVSNVVLDADRQ